MVTSFTACISSKVTDEECSEGYQIDESTRSCVRTLSASLDSISIESSTPHTSYDALITDVDITHSIEIETTGVPTIQTRWYVDGTLQESSNDAYSITLSPAVLGTGPHLIKVDVLDGSGTLADSESWSAQINAVSTPYFTDPSPSTALNITKSSSTPANTTFSITANDTNSIGYHYRWYLDGTLVSSGSANSNHTYSTDLAALSTGVHSVSVILADPTFTTHYMTYSWSATVSYPPVTTISSTNIASGTTITVIDGYDIGSSNFSDLCVAVTDVSGSDGSSGVSVEFFSDSVSIGSGSFVSDATLLCLDADGINTSLTYTDPGVTHTITAVVTDVDTGLQVGSTQSWNVFVRERNTAPVITTVSPTSGLSNPVAVAQKGNQTFTFTATDDDTSFNDFEVSFQVNGTNLNTLSPVVNGATLSAQTSVNSAVCTSTSSTDADKFTCNITFPAFYNLGPLTSSDGGGDSYTVTATVTDQAVNGGSARTSNTITWLVNTSEVNTTPTIIAAPSLTSPATAGGQTLTSASYIYASGDSTTAISQATEGDTIYINTAFSDLERDHYRRTVELSTNGGTTYAFLIDGPTIISRTDNTLNINTAVSYTLPQSIVDNPAIDNIDTQIRITIDDIQEDSSQVSVTPLIIPLNVLDNNPAPSISSSTPSPAVNSTQSVMTGYPFTIESNVSVTDASTASTYGDTTEYQWKISNDCNAGTPTYTDIPGETSTSMTWVPNNIATPSNNICFRLCIGDNGYGNDASVNCPASIDYLGAGGDDFIDNIYSDSNQLQVTGPADVEISANTNFASWRDTSGDDLFTATVSTTAGNIQLVKTTYNSTTGIPLSVVQDFPTDEEQATNDPPLNISIAGDSTFVWVAYYLEDTDKIGPSVLKVIRIRRFSKSDITAGYVVYDLDVASGGTAQVSVLGSNVFLPYLDASDSNKISIASFPTALGTPGTPVTLTTSDVTAVSGSNSMIEIASYGMDHSGTYNLYIAGKRQSSGEVEFNLINTSALGTIVSSKTSFSSSDDVSNLKIKVGEITSSDNDNDVFILGTAAASTALSLSHLDNCTSAACASSFTNNVPLDPDTSETATDFVFNSTNDLNNIQDFDFVIEESNLLFSTVYTGTAQKASLFNLDTTGGTLSLTALTAKSNLTSSNLATGTFVNLSQIKVDTTYGSDGATASENTQNTTILIYEQSGDLYSVLINTQSISNNVTGVDTTTGWRPPFVRP